MWGAPPTFTHGTAAEQQTNYRTSSSESTAVEGTEYSVPGTQYDLSSDDDSELAAVVAGAMRIETIIIAASTERADRDSLDT